MNFPYDNLQEWLFTQFVNCLLLVLSLRGFNFFGKIIKILLFHEVTICFIQYNDVDWHEIKNIFLSYSKIVVIWRKGIKLNNRSVALSLCGFNFLYILARMFKLETVKFLC